MARRSKKCSAFPSAEKTRSFYLSVSALFASLPQSCAQVDGVPVVVSRDSVYYFSVLFGYSSGDFSFFLKVLSKMPDKSMDLRAYAERCFPCVFEAVDIFSAAFSFLAPLKVPAAAPPFGQCPLCASWLLSRPLSGKPEKNNLKGFGSHIFCGQCHYERYSFSRILKNNLPEN